MQLPPDRELHELSVSCMNFPYGAAPAFRGLLHELSVGGCTNYPVGVLEKNAYLGVLESKFLKNKNRFEISAKFWVILR